MMHGQKSIKLLQSCSLFYEAVGDCRMIGS